jgi:hypothetical protein
MNRVDSLSEISPDVRKQVFDLYKKKLDELPFLENADEIKAKLVRDFQSEFNDKFSDRIVREVNPNIDRVLDEMINTNLLDGVPEGVISDNLRNSVSRNGEAYKDFIKNAKKKGSFLQNISEEEYNKIMQDVLSSAKRIDRDILDEVKKIFEKNPSWWQKLSTPKKIGFVLSSLASLISLGPTIGALFYYGTIARFKNFGDVTLIKKLFSGSTGDIVELTESNVENWFKSTYPEIYLDSQNFKTNFSITVNVDGSQSVIESKDGTKEWEVKLQDNKIVEI